MPWPHGVGTQINVSGTTSAVRADAMMVTPSYLRDFRLAPSARRAVHGSGCAGGRPAHGDCVVSVLAELAQQPARCHRPDDPSGWDARDRHWRSPTATGLERLAASLSLDGQQAERSARTLFVFGRLRSGASIESARAEMESIGQALEREFPTPIVDGPSTRAQPRKSLSARRRVSFLHCSLASSPRCC